LKKWDSYISLIKANSEVMTTMMEMEKQEKDGAPEEPEEKGLKEGEQQSADEEATSGSDGEAVMDLEKEDVDVKKEEKMLKEEALKMKEEIQEKEKEKKQEEDPMQKLFTELFHRVGKFIKLYFFLFYFT